jgi:hypothetical protein
LSSHFPAILLQKARFLRFLQCFSSQCEGAIADLGGTGATPLSPFKLEKIDMHKNRTTIRRLALAIAALTGFSMAQSVAQPMVTASGRIVMAKSGTTYAGFQLSAIKRKSLKEVPVSTGGAMAAGLGEITTIVPEAEQLLKPEAVAEKALLERKKTEDVAATAPARQPVQSVTMAQPFAQVAPAVGQVSRPTHISPL